MSDDPSNTYALLERWHGGDRVALDALIERDLPWVRRHVELRLGELLRAKGDVDDYVQAAMLQVLQYGPRFVMHDRAQFRALLAKITENVLRDEVVFHHAEKRDVARERPVPTDSILALDPPAAKSITRPSQAADRNERKSWIRLAIELLPAEDRALIRMREWQGRSFSDIASELGIAEDAARMRLKRVLPRLAKNIERLRNGEIAEFIEPSSDE